MRMLFALATVLMLGAYAGLTGGDAALYQSLADTDVQIASRTMQSTLERAPDGATRRGRTTRPAIGVRSRRPAPTSATAALSAASTARSWWSGIGAALCITPPAGTRTRVGYGSEGHSRGGGGRRTAGHPSPTTLSQQVCAIRKLRLGVRYCLPGHLAAMSAAEGEAAETAGKRTYAALTAGLRLTAVVPGTGAGWRPIAMCGRLSVGKGCLGVLRG